MITKVQKLVSDLWRLYIRQHRPAIVYTPGRVGSMSLILALQAVNVFSFKVEFLDRETLGSVWFCKKFIIGPQKPAKVITLVRDPIEILCSLFFSKLNRGRLSLTKEQAVVADHATLERIFLEEIIDGDYFDQYLRWYETEFTQHLHFNIYDHPFDTSTKQIIIEHHRYPTLILRSDLDNEAKEIAVKNFLNIPELEIENLNVKATRDNGQRYESFKENLCIPTETLQKIYHLNYAKHFFSPAEIETFVDRWS